MVSAGPLNHATVKLYLLKSNGAIGNLIATTTTDANGGYSLLVAAQSTPVILVASGGTYIEEGSGETVTMGSAQLRTVLPYVNSGQKVGVTPLTEIAAQTVIASAASNSTTALSLVVRSTNAKVASAMGLTDITIPPANPNSSAALAQSTQAAAYALVLGGLSTIAQSSGSSGTGYLNSLDVMQALATSFAYNGSLSSTVGAQNITLTSSTSTPILLSTIFSTVGSSASPTFSTTLANATTTYRANANAVTNKYNSTIYAPTPTYTSAPATLSGMAVITSPTAPTTIPSARPTVAGPPVVVAPLTTSQSKADGSWETDADIE